MKTVTRVQTGLRVEKRMLKVLKGLAEHLDISLAELFEGITLHAFENKKPFSSETLRKIEQLREVYDFDLRSQDAHALHERDESEQ